jgi:5-methylcytosine-specific restriction endonuclease McrA
VVKNPNTFCPAHQDQYKKTILNVWLPQRLINPFYFDVFDENKNRLCRACGKLLLNKDGTPTMGYWSCSVKCSWFVRNFDWGCVRYDFLGRLWIEQGKDPKGKKCQNCGTYRKDRYKDDIEIHHKVPIHCLDETNFTLVWDPKNLIALCRKCHGKAHKRRNLELKKSDIVTLDKWILKGEKELV